MKKWIFSLLFLSTVARAHSDEVIEVKSLMDQKAKYGVGFGYTFAGAGFQGLYIMDPNWYLEGTFDFMEDGRDDDFHTAQDVRYGVQTIHHRRLRTGLVLSRNWFANDDKTFSLFLGSGVMASMNSGSVKFSELWNDGSPNTNTEVGGDSFYNTKLYVPLKVGFRHFSRTQFPKPVITSLSLMGPILNSADRTELRAPNGAKTYLDSGTDSEASVRLDFTILL